MSRQLVWIVTFLCGLVFCGCTRFALIESMGTYAGAKVDVTPTTTYQRILSRVQKVALLAPDFCSNEGSLMGPGGVSRDHNKIRMVCGVQMAEIERGLSAAGLQVISWRDLRELARVEKLDTREAASALGAQVLFNINSLDDAPFEDHIEWKHEIYKSDAEGSRLGPSEWSPAPEPSALCAANEARMVDKLRNQIVGKQFCSIAVHVDAVDVASGEKIWYFKARRYPPIAMMVSTLGRFEDGSWQRARVATPLPEPVAMECSSAVYSKMLQDLATLMGKRFRYPGVTEGND